MTGIALVRKAKRIRRRTLRFVRSHRPQIHLKPAAQTHSGRAKASLERAREPFAEGFNWSLEFAEQLRKAKETGDHRKLLGETLPQWCKALQ